MTERTRHSEFYTVEKSGGKLGFSIHLLSLFVLWFVFYANGFAQVPDSLFSQARDENKTLQERIVLYDEIGWQTSAFDPEKAVLYADTAVQLARKSGDSAQVAFALNGKSIPYIRLGSHKEGLKVLEAAIAADTTDINLTAKIHSKIALVKQHFELDEEALESMIKAKRLFEASKDSVSLARITSNLGKFYLTHNRFDQAEKYVKEAVLLGEALKNDYVLMAAYRHISDYYELTNELDSAYLYAQLSTRLVKDFEFIPELASAVLHEATVLDKLERNPEALAKYRESLKYAQQVGSQDVIKYCHMNIGIHLFDQQLYKEAKPFLLQSIQRSEEQGVEEHLADIYKCLSDIYITESKVDSVQFYRNKYEEAFQRHFDAQEARNIAEITAKFDDARQKATIVQQDLELSEGKAIIAQQRLQNLALVGGFLLLVIGIVFWINRSKSKQKLALSKAVFNEREKGFSQVIEATELERDRISKDLHDGIGQQLTALKLSLNALSKKVEKPHVDDVQTVIESFTQSAEDVRMLSHQMMPRMLMDFGLPEAVDDLLKNSFLHAEISYEFQHKGMEQRLDKNIEIAVYRVIQELINNALKHSEAKSFSVQLIRSEKKLAGFILDDGKGFDPKGIAQGRGLKNISSRLSLIGGSIEIDSGSGAGTSVSISIPLS